MKPGRSTSYDNLTEAEKVISKRLYVEGGEGVHVTKAGTGAPYKLVLREPETPPKNGR